MSYERRPIQRVRSTRSIRARFSGVDAIFAVMDVSLGGFRVWGPLAFTAKATHTVEFTGNHISGRVPLQARVAYCRPCEVGRDRLFEIGFAFLPSDNRNTQARLEFLEHLIAVFEFEQSMADREAASF